MEPWINGERRIFNIDALVVHILMLERAFIKTKDELIMLDFEVEGRVKSMKLTPN